MSADQATSARRETSFRAAVRLLGRESPQADPSGPEVTLERVARSPDVPRLTLSESLEDGRLRTRVVPGSPTPGFAAFLDGTQQSRVAHWEHGIPIVHGTVAAVVRRRVDRRLCTWREPSIASRLYAPQAYVDGSRWGAIGAGPFEIVDTTARDGADTVRHPLNLLERAVHAVQEDRERAEQSLAARWCRESGEPLYVDGGLSLDDSLGAAPSVVGVVKSHRTLYVGADDLPTVLALREGERSSVFLLSARFRRPVASWYLRLHGGSDPLWGLVRIEIAPGTADAPADALTRRADEVSRWVLAERTPLALPDSRWAAMAYGIRDCEEFLRAVVGA
jgi:hypothetical protein